MGSLLLKSVTKYSEADFFKWLSVLFTKKNGVQPIFKLLKTSC